ncbi:lethal(3)malignant brain tumor-like protein 2 [Galendromus occidentalis]|uniref:Lethal(3)malignant brain tumor-like protein 2 n=1 Tax=Galendromus occidentalis TaxID=34638 RepID=A0AAJ6QQ73_9ACAR|nr:lethal(3)malignant brain tumor-like protein 2 [Galendromus occidentalis]
MDNPFWTSLASRNESSFASVGSFLHAPFSWDFDRNVQIGAFVESAFFPDDTPRSATYWLAEIVSRKSYYVRLRWLGGTDPNQDFWRNFGAFKEPFANQKDIRIHPVGWAKQNRKPFGPPDALHIVDKRSYMRTHLGGKQVLAEDFHGVSESENTCLFTPGVEVEVTDLARVSAVKTAVVVGDIGRRVQFRYTDGSGFAYFHEFSDMFYACGWARLHGREISASPEDYYRRSLKEILGYNAPSDRASIFNFKPLLVPDSLANELKLVKVETLIGAKLEIVDLLRPHCISVGRVKRILRNFYLMIEIDGNSASDGSDDLCVHISSPLLLPAGFASENGLERFFDPPYPGFDWSKETNVVPKKLLERVLPPHNFREGQFLEAVGITGSNKMYVARVERVVKPLLRIHYEGFPHEDDIFMPISSTDIYPAGWCEMVGHELITPLSRRRARPGRR